MRTRDTLDFTVAHCSSKYSFVFTHDFLYNSILYSSYGIQSIGYQDAQWQLIIIVSYFQITHYGEAMCHRTTGRHEHVIIYFVGIHINPTNFRKFVKLMTAIYYLLASKQK